MLVSMSLINKRNNRSKPFLFPLLLSLFLVGGCATAPKDPYLWLEEVENPKALSWVKAQNEKTLKTLKGSKKFSLLQAEALSILQAQDKIPYVSMKKDHLYNFWQDGQHIRGLWRRTRLNSYKKKKPQWEVLLDVDQLAKKEKENWVFKGTVCNRPHYDRCLIRLSRGGKDAHVLREFDLKTKKFVKNGFALKEAKSWGVDWIDRDHIFVATDFGPGSLTESGYPRQVRLWKRGEPLKKALRVAEASVKDMMAWGKVFWNTGQPLSVVGIWRNFHHTDLFLYRKGKLTPVPVQDSADLVGLFKNHFILELKKDWRLEKALFPKGSLVAVKLEVVKNQKLRPSDVELLFKKPPLGTLLRTHLTSSKILVESLEKVRGQLFTLGFEKGRFTRPKVFKVSAKGQNPIASYRTETSPYTDSFFITTTGFLNPDRLGHCGATTGRCTFLKSLPPRFSAQGMVVKQQWATSPDGTKVPYFLMGQKKLMDQGQAPTLLYGYGGFQISITPTYKPLVGKLWLEKGGLYAVANIRGGGEFGPHWHQSALKQNRQRAYDDFIAVAQDLIKRGVTSKNQLAIRGRSNGGLLVGAVMAQRPDLFKAVVCGVPLLDMMRYSQLLAGASWVSEYGDPKDPLMKTSLLSYSPYHNVSKNKKYPALLLTTSTQDDRVHPGHARKMAARMMDLGHHKTLYFENMEGGHRGSANLKQLAQIKALSYGFLWEQFTP